MKATDQGLSFKTTDHKRRLLTAKFELRQMKNVIRALVLYL